MEERSNAGEQNIEFIVSQLRLVGKYARCTVGFTTGVFGGYFLAFARFQFSCVWMRSSDTNSKRRVDDDESIVPFALTSAGLVFAWQQHAWQRFSVLWFVVLAIWVEGSSEENLYLDESYFESGGFYRHTCLGWICDSDRYFPPRDPGANQQFAREVLEIIDSSRDRVTVSNGYFLHICGYEHLALEQGD